MADPHTTVLRELLVRYLDTWTPTVLRSHRRATYIECGPFAVSALRVFAEFADRLAGHELDVVVLGAPPPTVDVPPGVSLRAVADPTELTGPMLAHLDAAACDVWQVVAALSLGKAREVLLTLPPAPASEVTAHRTRLREAGLAYVVAVELASDETARLLLFATNDPKHLATFKNELWSADEFAGIRYRDPHDASHTLIDISLNPQLLPLRRALLEELSRRGSCTVADLQKHTLQETIYRPAEAIDVLTAAATSGTITRDPPKGRMSPRTVVSHPH